MSENKCKVDRMESEEKALVGALVRLLGSISVWGFVAAAIYSSYTGCKKAVVLFAILAIILGAINCVLLKKIIREL